MLELKPTKWTVESPAVMKGSWTEVNEKRNDFQNVNEALVSIL